MIAQLDSHYIKVRPNKIYPRLISHFLFQGRFLTTNHRWLNRFILAYLKSLTLLPAIKSVRKPIFIIGTGRSGSTILGKVLSMHKDIGFLNEPKALWYTIHEQDDVNGHFSQEIARYHFDDKDATSDIQRKSQRLFAWYLTFSASTRVVDKNPEIIFRIPFVQAIFPEAKFVFLVRNAWDTCASIVKWSKQYGLQRNGQVEDWWGLNNRKWRFMVDQLVPQDTLLAQYHPLISTFEDHTNMAVVEWILTMREGLKYLNKHNSDLYLVKFEDLNVSPRQTLHNLSNFCELDVDETFLSYAEKTLSLIKPYPKPDIQADLHSPFQQTLRCLNYDKL